MTVAEPTRPASKHLRAAPAAGWAPAPPAAPRPRLHRSGIVVGALFTVWVTAMIMSSVAGWPLPLPMIVGAVLIGVWGALGDLYHHRGGRHHR